MFVRHCLFEHSQSSSSCAVLITYCPLYRHCVFYVPSTLLLFLWRCCTVFSCNPSISSPQLISFPLLFPIPSPLPFLTSPPSSPPSVTTFHHPFHHPFLTPHSSHLHPFSLPSSMTAGDQGPAHKACHLSSRDRQSRSRGPSASHWSI